MTSFKIIVSYCNYCIKVGPLLSVGWKTNLIRAVFHGSSKKPVVIQSLTGSHKLHPYVLLFIDCLFTIMPLAVDEVISQTWSSSHGNCGGCQWNHCRGYLD